MSENDANSPEVAPQAASSTPAEVADSGGAGGAPTADAVPAELFNRTELAEFDADDAKAGRAIGKLLSLFFFYTIVATSLVAWFTYNSLGE